MKWATAARTPARSRSQGRSRSRDAATVRSSSSERRASWTCRTSAAFQLAYGVTLGVIAALLAEVTFRGILQTRFESVLGPWPAILAVAAINTAAHRWGPDLAAQWVAFFLSLTALGWLRVVTRSLVPPLVAHGVANLVLGLVLWFAGPFHQGTLLTPENRAGLVSVVVIAILSLFAIVAMSRDRPQR